MSKHYRALSMIEQIDLQDKIEKLQAELDELKVSMAPTQPERQIDWPKMIGRLVMVRDDDTDDWQGPEVLQDYRQTPGYPFRVNERYWQEVKLYEGPTRPNWIEWSGGKRPVDSAALVLAELRSKELRLAPARYFRWGDNQQYTIVRYTVIEP